MRTKGVVAEINHLIEISQKTTVVLTIQSSIDHVYSTVQIMS